MGVGMPAQIWLDQFGSVVWDTFGETPYLVGSALEKKDGWRDVDVRVMLGDYEWAMWRLGDKTGKTPFYRNPRWVGLTLAFSQLGRHMTGLPIDFQLQPVEYANREFAGRPRSALGLVHLRMVVRYGEPP